MKDLKFIAGIILFWFGIFFGAGEAPDASFLEFVLLKVLAFAIIVAGLKLFNSVFNEGGKHE